MMIIKNLVLAAVIVLSGCSGYVNLGSQADKETGGRVVKFDYAGGYTSPERGLDILEQQAHTETVVLLEKQLREAIRNKDEAEITRLNNLVAGSYSASSQSFRNLSIINKTPDHVITVLDGPFQDLELAPGESSKDRRPIPVGLYKIKFEYCRNGSSSCYKKTVNVAIGKYRTEPLTVR